MEYRSVKGYSGLSQLGFLFAALAVGFILTIGIQAVITAMVLPKNFELTNTDAIMKIMLAPENVGLARVNQVLSTLALLFVPAICWNYYCNGKSLLWLGFSKHITGLQLIFGFLIIFVTSIAAGPLLDISKSILTHFPSIDATAKKMEDVYTAQALALSNLKSLPEYILGLFIMAFFPALFEEVFFRGTLQNLLVRWWKSPIVAILVTAIVFSLIHSSIYLFLTRMALGFVLGLMFYKTKNIWINIVAHFLNNAFALTALYSMKHEVVKKDLDSLEPHLHWSVALLALIGLVGLFYLLTNVSTKNKAIIETEENLLASQKDQNSSISHNFKKY
jgi:uncharacterized protein